jgi:hypothetical protein
MTLGTSANRPCDSSDESELRQRSRGSPSVNRYDRVSRACSSVDRASASGAEGRRFESCRARHYNLFRQRQRQSVRGGRSRTSPRSVAVLGSGTSSRHRRRSVHRLGSGADRRRKLSPRPCRSSRAGPHQHRRLLARRHPPGSGRSGPVRGAPLLEPGPGSAAGACLAVNLPGAGSRGARTGRRLGPVLDRALAWCLTVGRAPPEDR